MFKCRRADNHGLQFALSDGEELQMSRASNGANDAVNFIGQGA